MQPFLHARLCEQSISAELMLGTALTIPQESLVRR
jgi:hypothetical protein